MEFVRANDHSSAARVVAAFVAGVAVASLGWWLTDGSQAQASRSERPGSAPLLEVAPHPPTMSTSCPAPPPCPTDEVEPGVVATSLESKLDPESDGAPLAAQTAADGIATDEPLGAFAGLRLVFALGTARLWLRNRAKDSLMLDSWFILVLVALNLGAIP